MHSLNIKAKLSIIFVKVVRYCSYNLFLNLVYIAQFKKFTAAILEYEEREGGIIIPLACEALKLYDHWTIYTKMYRCLIEKKEKL